ncbi:Hypothetical protein R9X50_00009100 [Acrodontium crateriforme]|uniref:Uncharacterized protein n=1 Tax=Acrodontium crateriforme TaxID=150365 RepID=A0AAQ3LX61_9PEZI|nr:Hypothetical protein R9X50_00009100 [Acrodontium crateriforme]
MDEGKPLVLRSTRGQTDPDVSLDVGHENESAATNRPPVMGLNPEAPVFESRPKVAPPAPEELRAWEESGKFADLAQFNPGMQSDDDAREHQRYDSHQGEVRANHPSHANAHGPFDPRQDSAELPNPLYAGPGPKMHLMLPYGVHRQEPRSVFPQQQYALYPPNPIITFPNGAQVPYYHLQQPGCPLPYPFALGHGHELSFSTFAPGQGPPPMMAPMLGPQPPHFPIPCQPPPPFQPPFYGMPGQYGGEHWHRMNHPRSRQSQGWRPPGV